MMFFDLVQTYRAGLLGLPDKEEETKHKEIDFDDEDDDEDDE